jgi:S1-C subfamily serine protease
VDSIKFIDAILEGSPLGEAAPPVTEGDALDAYSLVVTSVAERLIPSVASLKVRRRVRGGRQLQGAGSGVAITPDGFLLTSAHVVIESDGGTATFADGRELPFEVVGTDPLSDMAVLRSAASDVVSATLGDADSLRVGQLVVAVGNPLGFSGSVTAGVVSALGRSLPTREGATVRFVEDVIQTDAALHPGNSGGALADSLARVVGINTAVVGPGIGQGLGLAIPINSTTRRIVATLMRQGRFRRAYLGIAGGPRPLPPRLARLLGREIGIEIAEVMPNSPASGGGLRGEDLILEVDGVPVKTAGDIQRLMVEEVIGRTVSVKIVRDGEVRELPITLREL